MGRHSASQQSAEEIEEITATVDITTARGQNGQTHKTTNDFFCNNL